MICGDKPTCTPGNSGRAALLSYFPLGLLLGRCVGRRVHVSARGAAPSGFLPPSRLEASLHHAEVIALCLIFSFLWSCLCGFFIPSPLSDTFQGAPSLSPFCPESSAHFSSS